MRLGIDADGVLADFDKGWIDRYNADFGTSIEYKHCNHWDALTGLTGLTYDQWWEWVTSKHEDLFLELEPLPGAVDGVKELKDRGHEICIVTAKPRWAAGHISSWLIKHDVPYDEIHVTSKKIHVACDVYVDDALHNVRDFLNHTDALVIQYSAWPYVNGGQRVPGAVQCRSWSQVVSAITDYDLGKKTEADARGYSLREALQGVFS